MARIFHELLAATTDLAVLPGVLGCRPLRRTVQVRLGTNTLRLPGGTPIFAVSRQQFMKYPGQRKLSWAGRSPLPCWASKNVEPESVADHPLTVSTPFRLTSWVLPIEHLEGVFVVGQSVVVETFVGP
ncbi:MAG: hypothetical protein OEV22_03925 [Deltaproteobacteria bacterium]|nr:hypothetical protein [Deltaproteobacteria bacterium]MDH3927075.1 hypothetical protein [Deltaproteobacteria bacterium]